MYLETDEVLRDKNVGSGLSDWTGRQKPACDLVVLGGKL